MSPEVEQLLRRARDADGPTRADEGRVLHKLHASIATGVVASVAIQSASLPGAASAGSTSALGSTLVSSTSALGSGLGKAAASAPSLWSAAGIKGIIGGALGSKVGIVIVCAAAFAGAGDASEDAVERGSRRTVEQASPTPVSGQAARGQIAPSARVEATPSVVSAEPESAAARLDSRKRAAVGRGTEAKPNTELKPSSAHPSPRSAEQSPSAPRSQAAAKQETLRAELELVRRVQLDLERGESGRALERLAEHRTKDQQLLAERRALQILALCANGDVTEARAQARRFTQLYPNSLLQRRIVDSCANPQRIGER